MTGDIQTESTNAPLVRGVLPPLRISDPDFREALSMFIEVQTPIVIRAAAMSIGLNRRVPTPDNLQRWFRWPWRAAFHGARAVRRYNSAILLQVILAKQLDRAKQVLANPALTSDDLLRSVQDAHIALKEFDPPHYTRKAVWNMDHMVHIVWDLRGMDFLSSEGRDALRSAHRDPIAAGRPAGEPRALDDFCNPHIEAWCVPGSCY